MAPKVTLKQIACEVGLSPSAVSLVLNNRPCRISEENRRRIHEAAARLHYVPNQIARSLVTRQSHTLGLIVPNIESRFFSSLAKNLEVRCRERGYALFIMNSDASSQNEDELVRLLLNRGADGLFLVTTNELEPDPQLVESLKTSPVPVVMVDRFIEEVPCDRVRFDSGLGGYLATKCLLEAGHRRISCIVNLSSHTGQGRLSGYRRALNEFGAVLDPALVFESNYYIADAAEAALGVLRTDATAVFATSDNIALGTLKCLYAHGKRVPRDYSLVSFDNSAADALFEPALTAIEQNVAELSENAIELLLARLEGDDAADAAGTARRVSDAGRAVGDARREASGASENDAEDGALAAGTPDGGPAYIERILPPRLVRQASVAPLPR